MKAGDTVRVTGGEFAGKTVKLLAQYQTEGIGRMEGENTSSMWFVEVVVSIHENNLGEIVKQAPKKGAE